MKLLYPMEGEGKEINDYLREKLSIPDSTKEYTVKFAIGDVITVCCEYYPEDKSENE